MEILLENVSEAKRERLLNPQMSDHFQTFMFGKFGRRLYTIKVGRKWVFMKSNSHRARLPLAKFKQLAFLEWRKCARLQASVEAMETNGNYKRKRGWWKAFGFETNPDDFIIDERLKAW